MFRILLSILISVSPVLGFAQTLGKQAEFNSARGVDYKSNLIKNPSCYENINGISGTGVVAQDTDAADQIDNKASCLLTLDAGEYIEFDLNTPSSEQTSGNGEFKGSFKGTAAGAKAQILDGSSVELASATLTTETGWRPWTFNNPLAASGARKVRINNPTGGTLSFNVGQAYYGQATNIAYGVPPQTFTASVSAAGVVSNEINGDWISGNCVVASNTFTCNFTTAFVSTPICKANSNQAAIFANATNTNTIRVIVTVNDDGGIGTTAPFSISCTKTGADAVQPAVTAANWNFEWTTCPSITSTHTTNATTTCKWKRQGGDAWFDVSTSYSGATDTANLQYTIPVTIDTSRMTQAVAGDSALDSLVGGAIDAGVATYTLSVNYLSTTSVRIVAGNATGTYVQTNNAIASNAVPFTRGSGDSSRVVFRVPVVGWLETYNALQLVGNITNDNTEKTFRTEYASISTAAAVTNPSTTGWVSCTGTTSITCTFAKAFTSTPNCQGTPVSPLGNFVNRNSVSTTQVVFNGYVSSTGAAQATAFELSCTGPRN